MKKEPPSKYRLVRETPEEAVLIDRIHMKWNGVEKLRSLTHNINGFLVFSTWIALVVWISMVCPMVWAGLAGCVVATYLGEQMVRIMDHNLFDKALYRLESEVDEVYAINAGVRQF